MTTKRSQGRDQSPLPTISDLNEDESFMDDNIQDESDNQVDDEDESDDQENDSQEHKHQKTPPGEARPSRIKTPPPTNTPVVRINREDGKFKKQIPIQLQGLTAPMLPPITKNKIAHYKVIGDDRVDPITGEYAPVPPVFLPGGFIVHDRFERDLLKRDKYIKYVTRSESVVRNGVSTMEEVVSTIDLLNGEMLVNIEEKYLLYVLMELHPLNESNRYRDKSQPAAFRRVDIHRKNWLENTEAGMNLAFEAEKRVVELRDPNKILEYAHACGVHTANRPLDSGPSSVKYDLRVFARNNPKEFFSLNKLNDFSIRINVMDAYNLGLIEYNQDRREWTFSTDGTVICRHTPTEDNFDYLVKCFAMTKDEGYQKAYQVLIAQLNYWE